VCRQRVWIAAAAFAVGVGWARDAAAWLFHEHAAVSQSGFQALSADERKAWRELWERAVAHEPRLCREIAPDDGARDPRSHCITFAALPAIAADHGCSIGDVKATLTSPWIQDVLAEAERARGPLEESDADHNSVDHVDRWHAHHANLLAADAKYLTRAEKNNGHFQAPRHAGQTLDQYLDAAIDESAPVNALGLYILFHEKARRLRRHQRFLDAVVAESLALHFLEDAFASGHVVATTGAAQVRMGTHDHYSENGIEVASWKGDLMVLYGDSFLPREPVETRRSMAEALARSLRDLLATTSDEVARSTPPRGEPDVCEMVFMPSERQEIRPEVKAVLELVPRAGLSSPTSATFSKEMGWFFTPGAQASGALLFNDSAPRLLDRLQADFGLGYTMGGLLGHAHDGVFRLSAVVAVGRNADHDGQWRLGSGLEWHLPICAVPVPGLDSLVGGVVYLFSHEAGLSWFRCAAEGGVFRLEGKFRLPFFKGLFQVVAVRAGSVVWFMDDSARGLEQVKLNGTPGSMQILAPLLQWESLYISEREIGFSVCWRLGLSLTRLIKNDDWVWGLYLSYGFKSRRYAADSD
jgi:hypothetical protein